ncbi:MAG: YebC/PmpR family DNA-binding transcriptional regulator [Mycoplasmataceae bacterium]|nr:YebC/PmpR family DNA-binding transcriptional regulator [Mycoplasmataceae bacterium]
MPRKHLIASQNNKKQQDNAKIWMKLAKEIRAAAKTGGPNIDANPRLKAAVEKALQNNLSKESIERNIKGAQKDTANLETQIYEVYGPNGLSVIISALTDNPGRTRASINAALSKLHGQIAKSNSVLMNFSVKGVFLFNSPLSEDEIIETLIDYPIDDINKDDEDNSIELICDQQDYYHVKKLLETLKDTKIISSEIRYIPNSYIDLSKEDNERLETFMNMCDQDDDVQWVVTNAS